MFKISSKKAALLGAVAANFAFALNAGAATFTVNSLADAVDANPSDGVCATAAGNCSLRAAVMSANATPGADIIQLGAAAATAPYRLTLRDANPPLFGDTNAAIGDLDISESVTIRGAGTDAAQTVIDVGLNLTGGLADRAFEVRPPFGPGAGAPIVVLFENFTIRRGHQSQDNNGGGAILVYAVQNGPTVPTPPQVTLRNMVLDTNYSMTTGSGLANYGGDVLIEDSVIRGNYSSYLPNNTSGNQNGGGPEGAFVGGGAGGGISTWSGKLTVRRSIIDANSAQIGGGIYSQDASAIPTQVLIEDSAISANKAFMGAGMFSMARGTFDFASGSVGQYGTILNRVTMETNEAEFAGGAIYNVGSTLLTNAVISTNRALDAPGNPNYRNKGGGIYNSGRVMSIVGTTVAGNEAQDARTTAANADTSYGGDEIFLDFLNGTNNQQNADRFSFTIQNTIIGDGPPAPPDVGAGINDNCNGPIGYEQYITSLGNNIDNGVAGTPSTCFAQVAPAGQTLSIASVQPTDIINPPAGPGLGELADNGSRATLPGGVRIKTRALTNGSAAVGAGAGCPGSDARGFARVGTCDVGSFQVNVNQNAAGNAAPTPVEDVVSTTAGAAVLVNVLFNDRDPDATDALSLAPGSIGTPANGTAAISGTSVNYTPAAGFGSAAVAEDTFTYGVSDGTLTATGTARVVVYPAGTNNPPVPGADTAIARASGMVAIAVLGNDTDPDLGDSLRLVSAVPTTQNSGNVQVRGQNVEFTPNQNFSGQATFSYVVADNRGAQATGQGTVQVNAAPVATGPTGPLSVAAGQSVTGRITASDPEGQALSYVVVTTPAQGDVTFTTPPGTFTYTAKATATAGAVDKFTLGASDGVDRANVEITVNITAGGTPGQGPQPQAQTLQYNTATMNRIQGTLTATNNVAGSQFVVTRQPTKGTLQVTATTGAFTYTANAGATGTDTFDFAVRVGQTDSAPATVTVNFVNQQNPGGPGGPGGGNQVPQPVALQLTMNTATQTTLTGTLQATFVSPVAEFQISKQPTQGSITSLDEVTGAFTYTPNTGATGTDSFDYRVLVAGTSSQSATVTITFSGQSTTNPGSGTPTTPAPGNSSSNKSSGGAVDPYWFAALLLPLLRRRRA